VQRRQRDALLALWRCSVSDSITIGALTFRAEPDRDISGVRMRVFGAPFEDGMWQVVTPAEWASLVAAASSIERLEKENERLRRDLSGPLKLCIEQRDAALDREDALRSSLTAQSESWRLSCLAWQSWAEGLVEQPEGGTWGAEVARERIGAIVKQRDAFQVALTEALIAWEQRIDQCDYPDNDAARADKKRIAELWTVNSNG
jgi:hypothetical protein